jgi:hypothetical protein
MVLAELMSQGLAPDMSQAMSAVDDLVGAARSRSDPRLPRAAASTRTGNVDLT